ncbi:hypothetical protein BDZ89DRAFT_1057892 [Hymenopellis radicata]|nr:hypothetical protein BDZ89DRAFT_1057892 [Hymenopellis radicata]
MSDLGCPQCGYDRKSAFSPSRDNSRRLEMLLLSNEAPIAQERDELHSQFASGTAYMSHLEEQIERTQATLDRLRADLARVQEFTQKTRIILHPIRILPFDVLSGIFLMAIEDDVPPARWPFMESSSMKSMQWVVSHVSSFWRSVALSTSRLWSRLSLTSRTFMTGQSVRSALLIGTHIERSHSLDLDIIISNRTSCNLSCHPVMPILLLSASRWKSLSLSIPHHELSAFRDIHHCFERLKHLEVYDLSLYGSNQNAVTLFGRNHGLESILMHHMWDLHELLRVEQFGGVQKFVGCAADLLMVLHLFEALPHLQQVELTLQGDSRHRLRNPLILRDLRNLDLQENGARGVGVISTILSSVRLPNVEKLKLSYSGLNPQLSHLQLSKITSKKLQHLHIVVGGMGLKLNSLIALLHSSLQISTLVLGFICELDLRPVFSALLVPYERAGLEVGLPMLESLEVEAEWGVQPGANFIPMIRSRRAGQTGVALLRKCIVKHIAPNGLDEESFHAFTEFCNAGMVGGI